MADLKNLAKRSHFNQNINLDTLGIAEDEIKQIHADMQRDRPSIPEDVFKHVFLPFFAGTPKEELKYKVDIGNWLAVAGNVFQEVDVVDPAGTVLFAVPPVMDRHANMPNQSEEAGTIPSLMMTVEQLRMRSPRQAAAFMDRHLTNQATAMFNPNNILPFLRRWNEIFVRYGYKPLLELKGETTQAAGVDKQATPVKQEQSALPEDEGDWETL